VALRVYHSTPLRRSAGPGERKNYSSLPILRRLPRSHPFELRQEVLSSLTRNPSQRLETCMPTESQDGPFVSIACICQSPLQETSGHLSIIRVVDRIPVVGAEAQMQPQPLTNLFLVVLLRSGVLRESYAVKIKTISPTGQLIQQADMNVLFEGEDRGPAIISPLALVVTEKGLYWIEISLEDRLLSRIPLRIQYQRVQALPFLRPPSGPTG
jgi:hypothetical protein